MDRLGALALLDSRALVEPVREARPGKRRFGVPPGGPWDPFAWRCGACLAGGAEGWETASPQPGLWLEAEVLQPLRLAVMGEGGWVEALEGRVRTPALAVVPAGSRLRIGSDGAARLLLLAGPGEAPWGLSRVSVPLAAPAELPFFGQGDAVEGVLSPSFSRVGVRLLAASPPRPALDHSEPSVAGAVQATPSGDVLIHGPEGPTIGGYPKIGCLGPLALGLLSRVRPGQRVRLSPDPARARALEADLKEQLAERLAILERVKKWGLILPLPGRPWGTMS